ncbi:MAG: glycoside hydrolase family 3 N-terminal domain-containing protein, partial [bacterium]
MKRYIVQILALLFFFTLSLTSNRSGVNALEDFDAVNYPGPVIFKADTAWVDSVLNTMSVEEKIGQLIMVDAYSRMGEDHERNLLQLIKKYHVGGFVFFKGGPMRQAKMINSLQENSGIPLLISQDAEWGPGWRLDSTISYPRQMMLGAIEDESLIYQMGYDIGKQLRRVGVHVNFAPVVDINNNPDNPVINSRSFGEDRMNVARKAVMYAQGLQDAGVIPVFKHFPGHGDTNMDSHHTLPVIDRSFDRLDSLELFPFKFGIEKGIPAIMSGHLHVPAMDSSYRLAASLSPRILTGFLRNTMGFKGLIFTDGLGMRGVSSYFEPGELEAAAFKAGNDILLMPPDVPRAVNYLKREIRKGNISEERLDESVRRILFAKAWAGLDEKCIVDTDSIYENMNDPFYKAEKARLIRNALTLLKNKGSVIPFRNLESYNIASLAIGNGQPDEFTKTLKNYTEIDAYYLNRESVVSENDPLLRKLDDYNTLIVSIHNTSQWPARNYGIYPHTRDLLDKLDFKGNLVLVLFGNPYALDKLGNVEKFNSVVLAYEDEPEVKYLTAQGIFGSFPLKGKLPVSVLPGYEIFSGLRTEGIHRLSYGSPEEVMIDSRKLMKIDSIVEEAIDIKAIPGCQVLVARRGKVILKKNYGWHSYRRNRRVEDSDLYDIASITKISATLPALMKLEGEGRFSTEDSLGYYLQLPDTSDKNSLLIKDILSHQSGLTSWIPFYYRTLQPLDTSEALVS